MKRLAIATVLALGGGLLAAAPAYANYWVYCDNGRIVVESRSPQQMEIARGSSACQMGPTFSFASDAQGFAERNFGGVGRACSCR
ncbi:hypothetical protein [Neoroseomonas oryzicola]|uniref:DUF4087 domain-containing protein n=1 Tax=Neoroseomonas oryzicola TaxID=535904 RepID=A0A9X9WK66_9PROT|nr:hypothetical protein [Neoroseomonas oryzicola]MBR0660726.1 hypothetical protein [Neoroseomonas oryzicola]NKE15322.1 hypothetical protein [Neoroseomonas oryzicola]